MMVASLGWGKFRSYVVQRNSLGILVVHSFHRDFSRVSGPFRMNLRCTFHWKICQLVLTFQGKNNTCKRRHATVFLGLDQRARVAIRFLLFLLPKSNVFLVLRT